jgi:riboflavin transporter FmnP
VVPENDPLIYSGLVKTASIICLLIIWINLFWVCKHWKNDTHTSSILATIVHALFWTVIVVLNVFFSVGLLS